MTAIFSQCGPRPRSVGNLRTSDRLERAGYAPQISGDDNVIRCWGNIHGVVPPKAVSMIPEVEQPGQFVNNQISILPGPAYLFFIPIPK